MNRIFSILILALSLISFSNAQCTGTNCNACAEDECLAATCRWSNETAGGINLSICVNEACDAGCIACDTRECESSWVGCQLVSSGGTEECLALTLAPTLDPTQPPATTTLAPDTTTTIAATTTTTPAPVTTTTTTTTEDMDTTDSYGSTDSYETSETMQTGSDDDSESVSDSSSDSSSDDDDSSLDSDSDSDSSSSSMGTTNSSDDDGVDGDDDDDEVSSGEDGNSNSEDDDETSESGDGTASNEVDADTNGDDGLDERTVRSNGKDYDENVAAKQAESTRIMSLSVVAITCFLVVVGLVIGVWWYYGKKTDFHFVSPRHIPVDDAENDHDETEFAVMVENDGMNTPNSN